MSVDALVGHLFRHSAGQMVAVLTRVLGADRLDLAEEVVQDAMLRALELWPYQGVPDNPRGWLFRVARNRALDVLRRDTKLSLKLAQGMLDAAFAGATTSPDVFDDELAMIVMCCHPGLPYDARVSLTLKTVCGFSVREIAAALLAEPAAVAQRLVRAKKQIREHGITFELPAAAELGARMPAVLDVLYLLFNEGYEAHAGDVAIRTELCEEAIRLTRLLARDARTNGPRVQALLALMLLQSSRLSSRRGAGGAMLLLMEQDRTRWDRVRIAEGVRAFEASMAGDELTPYHIQAAIAAAHAAAPTFEQTDWPHILRLYDQLAALAPSAVVAVNRAVAVWRVHGAHAAQHALQQAAEPSMERYLPYAAVAARLAEEAGDAGAAARWYRHALELPANAAQQRFLAARLELLEAARGR